MYNLAENVDANYSDDYLEEELDASITNIETQTKIEHSQGHILIEENKITQARDNNVMTIEAGRTTTCTYHTEHGDIELKIEGIKVERLKDEKVIGRARYLISTNGVNPYQVEIEITKA